MGEQHIHNDGPVQGQNIGDHNTNTQHYIETQNNYYSSGNSSSAVSPSLPSQRIWNIPYPHNPFFTGRKELLSRLQKQLRKGQKAALSQPQAVSGLGGIGKTQIAIEYAHKHRQKYHAVLWARAESHEALTSSFVEIATLLGLPQKDEKDQTITVDAVKRWLQENKGWLLILDNADEPAIVREFLPTKFDGHMLLTTRAQALGGLAQRIDVDTFASELGALFLLRRATLIAADRVLEQATSQNRDIATQISEELGGLPLALDQAGAYIEQTQCSLSDYLGLYRTRRTEMLQERGYLVDGGPEPDYPETVATTWSISFEKVEQASPAAAELLRLCAYLAPDAIPEEIITKGAEHLGPLLQTVARDPMALNKAIAALGAYSLIHRNATEKTLSIHRLVQAVLQDTLEEAERRAWAQRAMVAVNGAFPHADYDTWFQCERFLPQVLTVTQSIEQYQMITEEAGRLLHETASYLEDRARYVEAEQICLRALSIREQQLGPEHSDVASTLNNLAIIYYNQGKYTEAEPLYQRALRIWEQSLGFAHPQIAHPLNNLASLYKDQGKYAEAEPLYQRALRIREQSLGPDHPDVAYPLNGLATLYREQGKYAEAKPLYQRALRIREQSLGPNHPDVAYPLNNLAIIYFDV